MKINALFLMALVSTVTPSIQNALAESVQVLKINGESQTHAERLLNPNIAVRARIFYRGGESNGLYSSKEYEKLVKIPFENKLRRDFLSTIPNGHVVYVGEENPDSSWIKNSNFDFFAEIAVIVPRAEAPKVRKFFLAQEAFSVEAKSHLPLEILWWSPSRLNYKSRFAKVPLGEIKPGMSREAILNVAMKYVPDAAKLSKEGKASLSPSYSRNKKPFLKAIGQKTRIAMKRMLRRTGVAHPTKKKKRAKR